MPDTKVCYETADILSSVKRINVKIMRGENLIAASGKFSFGACIPALQEAWRSDKEKARINRFTVPAAIFVNVKCCP